MRRERRDTKSSEQRPDQQVRANEDPRGRKGVSEGSRVTLDPRNGQDHGGSGGKHHGYHHHDPDSQEQRGPHSHGQSAAHPATHPLCCPGLPDQNRPRRGGQDQQRQDKGTLSTQIRIPDEMSVIGFDDVTYTAQMSPPLTTIHQPLTEMGKMAANMLLRLIAGQQLDSNHVELSTSLVVRESCAVPRNGPLPEK